MSDSKITSLPATATLLTTDLLTVVTDPAGSPTNKKITMANMAVAVLATASADVYTVTNAVDTKSLNATDTSLDNLANVLGTLIASLRTAGIIK